MMMVVGEGDQLTVALTGAMHMSATIRSKHGCADFISIEDHIVPELRDTMGVNVELHEGDWTPIHVKGGLKRFKFSAESKATIYYPHKYNYCNKRFVVAKELAYLLHEWGVGCQTRTEAEAESLVDYITNPEFAQATNDQKMAMTIGAEEFAELYALEILLPHSHRAVLNQEALSVSEIASRYRVPKSKVEIYLNPTYVKICEIAAEVFSNSK